MIEQLIKNYEITSKELGFGNKKIGEYTNKLIDFRAVESKEDIIWKTEKPGFVNLSTTIVEEAPNGSLISYDLFSRLLRDRVVYFCHEFSSETCNIAIGQLLFLEMVDKEKDINLIISSGGGSVVSGLSLIDTMRYIACDVSTMAIGMAASMGAVTLSCGTPGKRSALKHTEVMIHQISSQMGGTADSIKVSYEQMQKYEKILYNMLSETSGHSYEEIEEKCKLDYWMTSEEAKKENFIDKILIKRGE